MYVVFGYFDLFIIHSFVFRVSEVKFQIASDSKHIITKINRKNTIKLTGHLIIEIVELKPKHKKYFGKRIN